MAQKRVTKPLFLKYGKFAGKSTITVSGRDRGGERYRAGGCGWQRDGTLRWDEPGTAGWH